MRSWVRRWVWLSAACLVVVPAAGTEAAETGTPMIGKPTLAGGEPLPIEEGVLRLSLSEAVRLAIQRSLDVQLLRFDPYIAEEDLGAAWGAYDPQIYGEGGFVNSETPTANQILGNVVLAERTYAAEGGLRGLIPWLGGSYQVGYAGSQVKTNSRIAVLSPEHRANFLATLQFPLLRGLFWSQEWTLVRAGRVGLDASHAQFASNLMDVVSSTENAYWALIAAQESTRVALKSLETARALLEQTQAQYEVGVVSRVEVVQAEAGVADREFVLIREQAIERNQQDALIDRVLGPYLEPDTRIQVALTDRPEELSVLEVSEVAATEHAMARRPELVAARKAIEGRQIEAKYANNQRLPQLDVVGTYGQSGLSGSTNPNCQNFGVSAPCTDVPGLRRDWIDADNVFFDERAADNYSVQGVLSIPLGNSAARHRYRRALFEMRRSETELKRLEQSIVSEIRRAARNLGSAVEGIEAAERAVVAAEEQLRAERVRLEYGESTPFDVLQREEDLVRAESQKILAQQAYHDSVTALDRAQGTILERHQIRVDDAETLR